MEIVDKKKEEHENEIMRIEKVKTDLE